MHAVYLRRAGYEVAQLEADLEPRSASVRNFGLIWVGGRRGGAELNAALRARGLWEELASKVPGIGFRPDGSLTVAQEPAALKVMEAFVDHPDADVTGRGIELLDAADVARVNPAVHGEVLGALRCRWDAVVEPRAVLPALRARLEAAGGYEFSAGTAVVDLDEHAVVDGAGRRWDGDVVVVATGAEHRGLFRGAVADALGAAPLQPVRLQMLQTEPHPERLATSLADADSLRYYPAYEVAPLDALGSQSPVARRHHLQLLVAQRGDGGLTIGDTHLYQEPFDFDLDEAPSEELLHRAASILGRPLPPVARRWAGVYLQRTDTTDPTNPTNPTNPAARGPGATNPADPAASGPGATAAPSDGAPLCYRTEIRSGVWLVTGPGGRGMTCAPVIALDTLRAAGIEADLEASERGTP
jgi:FAD dependent oxidoreductase TIGR03364